MQRPAMTWLVPAVGALILWGLWAFLPKLSVRYLDPMSVVVYDALAGVVVGTVLLVVLRGHPQTDATGIALGLATGATGLLGTLLFLHAVSRGRASIVIGLTALYPVVAIALSVVVLHERIAPRELIGIAFALVAVVLLAR